MDKYLIIQTQKPLHGGPRNRTIHMVEPCFIIAAKADTIDQARKLRDELKLDGMNYEIIKSYK